MISENRALLIVSPITVLGPGLALAGRRPQPLYRGAGAHPRPHRPAGGGGMSEPVVRVAGLKVAYATPTRGCACCTAWTSPIGAARCWGWSASRAAASPRSASAPRLPPSRHAGEGGQCCSGGRSSSRRSAATWTSCAATASVSCRRTRRRRSIRDEGRRQVAETLRLHRRAESASEGARSRRRTVRPRRPAGAAAAAVALSPPALGRPAAARSASRTRSPATPIWSCSTSRRPAST